MKSIPTGTSLPQSPRYLLALQEKNEVVRARLREYELEMRDREELERELKALEEHNQYARSCHFMVSTKVVGFNKTTTIHKSTHVRVRSLDQLIRANLYLLNNCSHFRELSSFFHNKLSNRLN